MEDFIFRNETELIFGRNKELLVGKKIKRYSDNALLVYGSERIKISGLYTKIITSLDKENIHHVDFPGALPNPKISHVRNGIKIVKEKPLNFILAIGGGSVIDTAKAIAIGACGHEDVWDYFFGKEVTNSLPTGVILTYPAAGSESSDGAVLTNEDGLYKRPVQSEVMRPKFAILNPELTFSLTSYQTAVGIVDMISHLLERYFTNVLNTALTDRLIEGTITTIIRNSEKVINNPTDYNARSEIMFSSTIAHNDWFTCGRIGDWASHNIEHELSGLYDIAHGEGLAIIMPAWMKYCYKDNIDRFQKFANHIFKLNDNSISPQKQALVGIEKLSKFFNSLGLPTKLTDIKSIKIRKESFSDMAKKCTENGHIGNLKKLFYNDVLNILNIAWE